MTREEYANRISGYDVSVTFDKIIMVSEPRIMPYSMQYKDISKITKFKKIVADMPEGQAKKRIKQLESLGYEIKDTIWRGQEKWSRTKILIELSR